jgi:type I restriction enzyme S subunit
MSFPGYQKYKYSGDPWLGNIPAHWEGKPLKRMVIVENSGAYGTEPEDGNCVLPVATTAQIGSDGFFNVKKMPLRGFSASERTKYECRAGDILVVKSSGSAANIISGKAGYVRKDTPKFIFSNFLLRLRVSEIQYQSAFLYSLIISDLTRERVKQMCSTTTYPNLQVGMYSNAILPCPPYDEQIQIINFLDHETAKIDTLIHEQKRLIELLKEKRQAVISHAVTKGLDPDVPMKDSGVEWLGEVPAHWEIPKLSWQSSRIGDGLHSTPEYEDKTGYYFVNGNNLVDGRISLFSSAKEVSYEEFVKHQVELGPTSVFISINGTIGNVAIYEGEPVILGKSAAYINCGPELHRKFLLHYLKSGKVGHYFDLEMTGTTIFNLSLRSLRHLKVNLPPLMEQEDIVKYLDAECQRYEDEITVAESLKRLLVERRSALISAAVTGKIDVRNWQPPADESAFDEEMRQAEMKVTA